MLIVLASLYLLFGIMMAFVADRYEMSKAVPFGEVPGTISVPWLRVILCIVVVLLSPAIIPYFAIRERLSHL